MIVKMIEGGPWGRLTTYQETTMMRNTNPYYRIKPMMGPTAPVIHCQVTYQVADGKILLLEIRAEDRSEDRFGHSFHSQQFSVNRCMDLKEYMEMFTTVPTPLRTEMTDILYGK